MSIYTKSGNRLSYLNDLTIHSLVAEQVFIYIYLYILYTYVYICIYSMYVW